MICASCGSENLLKLSGEIPIRFSGTDPDGPPIRVVSELLICLACDVALFAVPEAELRLSGKLKEYQERESH